MIITGLTKDGYIICDGVPTQDTLSQFSPEEIDKRNLSRSEKDALLTSAYMHVVCEQFEESVMTNPDATALQVEVLAMLKVLAKGL